MEKAKNTDSMDWRKKRMSQIRKLIKQADPEIVEEVKYKMPSNPDGIPVWYCYGMICTGETYKQHLRLTFAKGPAINDPKGIFNRHSAIVIKEEDEIDEAAFIDVIRDAVELNRQSKTKPKPGSGKKK